jgi:hypothetical protein
VKGLKTLDAKVNFTNITLAHCSVGPNISVWINEMV